MGFTPLPSMKIQHMILFVTIKETPQASSLKLDKVYILSSIVHHDATVRQMIYLPEELQVVFRSL